MIHMKSLTPYVGKNYINLLSFMVQIYSITGIFLWDFKKGLKSENLNFLNWKSKA
jgi:hypothetical protein